MFSANFKSDRRKITGETATGGRKNIQKKKESILQRSRSSSEDGAESARNHIQEDAGPQTDVWMFFCMDETCLHSDRCSVSLRPACLAVPAWLCASDGGCVQNSPGWERVRLKVPAFMTWLKLPVTVCSQWGNTCDYQSCSPLQLWRNILAKNKTNKIIQASFGSDSKHLWADLTGPRQIEASEVQWGQFQSESMWNHICICDYSYSMTIKT